MKKIEEERIIKVPVIKFDDGSEIDAEHICKFLEESIDIIDTIGKSGNYTSNYLYFETAHEKKLESILLNLDVIRKSPNHKYNNDKVGTEKYYVNYFYWLSDGYFKFREMFYKVLFDKK